MDGVGTVGREVNGDPFSTGVKHGDEGGGGGEEGERNRLWTSKYDKQVSQSVSRPSEKEGSQCSPRSIRYGEWGISSKGIPGTKRRIRDGALAFVRGKLFPSPVSPCLKIRAT